MSIAQSLLPEFDVEMARTRKTLERVPMEKAAWKPHPKSGALGWLANHVATLPGWAKMTLETEFLDLAASHAPATPPKTVQELVQVFDKHAAESRAAIEKSTDEQWMKPWTLKMGDHVIFTMPRVAVLRNAVMNHLIHHRGQLTMYLRLNDVPVPALFGPSADEQE